MTRLLQAWLDSPVLIAVGWALLVVLWHSTLVGLTLAIWRSWRADARPRKQYRAAALALGVVVLLAGLTPALVLSASGELEVAPANEVTGGLRSAAPGPQHSAAWSTALQAVESETTVAMPLPTEEQLKEAAAGDGSLQFFFGVVNVRFANGFEWQVTPNTAEVSGDKALGLPSPQLPRAVLARQAGDPSGRVCRDEQGDVYSLGAVVPIQNEPGRFARCEAGRWVERAARR